MGNEIKYRVHREIRTTVKYFELKRKYAAILLVVGVLTCFIGGFIIGIIVSMVGYAVFRYIQNFDFDSFYDNLPSKINS